MWKAEEFEADEDEEGRGDDTTKTRTTQQALNPQHLKQHSNLKTKQYKWSTSKTDKKQKTDNHNRTEQRQDNRDIYCGHTKQQSTRTAYVISDKCKIFYEKFSFKYEIF